MEVIKGIEAFEELGDGYGFDRDGLAQEAGWVAR